MRLNIFAKKQYLYMRETIKHIMETVTIPKSKYDQMVAELETLRRTDLYKRLLQFIQNIQKKKFTRRDLGF